MARTTSKVVAPSSATKGKAADKPAAPAPKAAVATENPVVPEAAGDTLTGAPAAPVVALPPVVATAVLAAASALDSAGPDDADADADADGDADADADADATAPALGEIFPVRFPVVLKLTNAWQGRHDVAGTNETLAPGETRDVEFTEPGLKRFSRQILQLADLHGWKEGQGILIEQGADHGED